MKISEMIEELQKIKEESGDVDVKVYGLDRGLEPANVEFHDGFGFVIIDEIDE